MKKAVLVTNMIEAVRSKSNAGGFVKPYKNGQWYVVGDSAVREKVGQSLCGQRSTIGTPRPSAEKQGAQQSNAWPSAVTSESKQSFGLHSSL
jgi:hypothetical protein